MDQETLTNTQPAAGAVLNQDLAGKYLTFHLAEEVYGLVILKVQEIIGVMSVTKVPRMPEFIRGVINLRGKIIPVIDLRLQFGLQGQQDTAKTCIIVVQIARGDHKITMGIIVDEVAEVINLKGEQIEPPPSFGTAVSTDFILGMGKVSQKVIMLLDIDRILATEQLSLVVEQTQA
jgi:purine-binding chemotaxis protein CheW